MKVFCMAVDTTEGFENQFPKELALESISVDMLIGNRNLVWKKGSLAAPLACTLFQQETRAKLSGIDARVYFFPENAVSISFSSQNLWKLVRVNQKRYVSRVYSAWSETPVAKACQIIFVIWCVWLTRRSSGAYPHGGLARARSRSGSQHDNPPWG